MDCGSLVEASKDSVDCVRVASPYIHVRDPYDIIHERMRENYIEESMYIHEAAHRRLTDAERR